LTLVDTHALVWWLLDDPRLSPRARREITAADEVLMSAASGWEIATKHRVGKLDLKSWSPGELPDILERARIEVLDVSLAHALRAGQLPGVHRDPFDRLLIAQSQIEELSIVTADPVFTAYGVDVIW
jgi:PIN domain nuclease of toxin-antitoxin system